MVSSSALRCASFAEDTAGLANAVKAADDPGDGGGLDGEGAGDLKGNVEDPDSGVCKRRIDGVKGHRARSTRCERGELRTCKFDAGGWRSSSELEVQVVVNLQTSMTRLTQLGDLCVRRDVFSLALHAQKHPLC